MTTNSFSIKDTVSQFFFLIFLYFIVNIVTSTDNGGGGIFNQIVAGVFILYCGKSILLKKSYNDLGAIYKVTLWLIAVFSTREIYMYASDPKLALFSIRSYIVLLFWMIGLVFATKSFRIEERIKIEKLIRLFVLICFAYMITALIKEHTRITVDQLTGAVGAAGSAYLFVPLILLAFKGRMKIYLYIGCLVICSLSQKRQALLGFALVSLPAIPILYKCYKRNFKVAGVALIGMGVFFASSIFYKLFGGLIVRQQAIADSNRDFDSGRTVLRELAMRGFNEASVADQIFGGGAGAGGRYVENYLGAYIFPHNGFIDILCCYGYVGIILYILLFYAVLKQVWSFKQYRNIYRIGLGMFLGWFSMNCISHADNVWLISICILLGYMVNCIKSWNIADINEQIEL